MPRNRSAKTALVLFLASFALTACDEKGNADDPGKAAAAAMQTKVGDCEDYPVKGVQCTCFKSLVSEKATPGFQSALAMLAKTERGDVSMKTASIGQPELDALMAVTTEAETLCAPQEE